MGESDIDWSEFEGHSEHTLTCGCGMVFRSHAKAFYAGEHQGIHSRQPCPQCGQTDKIRQASTDPESFSIGREGSNGG